jgi:hypothetical protein
MHNGGIAGFPEIKMDLHLSLSRELYNFPQGNTGMLVFLLSSTLAKVDTFLNFRLWVGFCFVFIEGWSLFGFC